LADHLGLSGEACVEEVFAFHQPWSLLPFATTGKIEGVSLDQSTQVPDFQPASACSYAELRNAELMATAIESTGRAVRWRPVWVRTGVELLAAGTAVAATLAGLVALLSPLVSGVTLALLLALWSLQLGGLPSPLAYLCPTAATQDLLAPDPTDSTQARPPTLLLVRTDLPSEPRGATSIICARATELTWLITALTLVAVAARALDMGENTVGVIQSIPALASLALLAVVLVAKPQPTSTAVDGWTGITTALELIAYDTSTSYNLTAVGATGLDGSARALKADPSATTAWRCWEFSSAEQLRAAINSSG
jgi:hypothetical protein